MVCNSFGSVRIGSMRMRCGSLRSAIMIPPRPSPLPRDRFPAFRAFVRTTEPPEGFPAGPEARLRWVEAAAIAASAMHMLGRFQIASVAAAEIEDEALAWWLS